MILKELVQTRDEDSVIIYSNYLLQMKMTFFYSVKQKGRLFEEYIGDFFFFWYNEDWGCHAPKWKKKRKKKCIIKVVHASQAMFRVIYVNNTLKFEKS